MVVVPLGSASAADKVTVGVLRFVSSGGLFLAAEQGFFKEQGIDVDLRFFEAAQPIAVAVASRDLDFGLTAFTAGAFTLAGKGGLKIVAAQAKEAKGYEGNAVLASKAAFDKGLTSVDKLAGRTVGITQVGSSFHYQLGQLARLKGFDLKSVEMKPLQSLPNMVAALKTSQVDAIIIAPHLARPLIQSGDGKLLGWYSDFDEYQFGGLFAGVDMLTKRRDVATRFVRAYQKGEAALAGAFFAKPRDEAAATAAARMIAKHVFPGEDDEKAIAQVKAAVFYVDPAARLDVADIYKQVAWLKSQGLVDSGLDAAAILDLGLVEGHMNVPK